MAELNLQDMASKLLADRFTHDGPAADSLSDPIADTPMTVTLDQLRPYDLNPRVTRNPRHDDIKASIRERGLDAPPAITRRPGEPHYIIRNGGNTRLAILRELWSETKDERFFRIPCLFRPWPVRGEIIALTGHLAENELHGGLSFIERALGIERARALYEQESGQALTQTQLARRLSADGYPISQPHISRMQDAVRYLLPAIPTVLYGGLGRPQIERLTALRKAGARIWEARSASRHMNIDFPSLFNDVLALFNADADRFSIRRIQDELIGQMADLLEADYDTLTLEVTETENRQHVLSADPSPYTSQRVETPASPATSGSSSASPTPTQAPTPPSSPQQSPERAESHQTSPVKAESLDTRQSLDSDHDEPLHGHIVSPAPTTERLQSIQRLVAEQMGDTLPDFEANVLQAIPVQAGGLYPISDVWYIEPSLNTPEHLRVHIAQFAREIAGEVGQTEHIESVEDGIGFVCTTHAPSAGTQTTPLNVRGVLSLLRTLSAGYHSSTYTSTALDELRLTDTLGPLLQGSKNAGKAQATRLSDTGLIKLFRLLRLARRLLELEADTNSATASPSTP